MKRLMMVVLSMVFAVGVAVAGNIDSPGAPSAGSGMYTLQNLYDYLMSGTALTVAGSFQEPTAGPGSTMKNTKEIGDGIKGQFDQCDVAAADVALGKKFFCTQSGSWGVKTGTLSTGLLKTGQTVSYKTGDDGSYQKGQAFSYSWDVNTDTVKDNNTGLVWASSGAAGGCKSGDYIAWSSAIDWAEALVFAGYSDWRLPNVTEAQSILVREAGQASPRVNSTFFPSTVAGSYWSSTTKPAATTQAFAPSTNSTTADGGGKDGVNYVRAVRGGN